jgi:hypothetical protein
LRDASGFVGSPRHLTDARDARHPRTPLQIRATNPSPCATAIPAASESLYPESVDRARIRAIGHHATAVPSARLPSRATVSSRRLSGDERRLALLIGVLGAAALCLLSVVLPKEGAPHGDDLIYEDIARNPFGTHTFPFGYRLGLPLLVHVLPFAHPTSFLLLAWLAAGGAAAFAYLLMRELGAERTLAASLAGLLSVSPPLLVVALRHGRNTDIATVFLMMAATYFTVARKQRSLAVTLLVGAVVREAVLFVIPLAYALWAVRPLDRRAALQVACVAAPAVVLYVAIRLSVHTVGEAQVPGYGGSLLGERFTVLKSGLATPGQTLRRLLSIYGPLWLLAPLALAHMAFARRGLVLVALALLSMTFALDWGRMILLAAPVFYPAAAHTLEEHPRWRTPALACFALLIVGYAIYMGVSGVSSGILKAAPPPYPLR